MASPLAEKFPFGPKDAVRTFTRAVKDACWNSLVPGRDPARWRFDAAGNIVCYRLRGCTGCLCHEYDHVVPHARGGPSVLANCQVLQTRVNRRKADAGSVPRNVLASYSCEKRAYTDAELDVLEIALYGSVRRLGVDCRVSSLFEAGYRYANPARNGHPPQKQSEPCPLAMLYPLQNRASAMDDFVDS